MRQLQAIPTYEYNWYQHKVRFSEISKLEVYLHITHIYRQAQQFSEMTSPMERNFYMIEYMKTNYGPVFSGLQKTVSYGYTSWRIDTEVV
jgi:hypothetical protein